MAQGTSGNDTLYNFNAGASLDAGAGNDFVQNQSARSTIFGGAGNDTLYNTSGGSNSVLDGGNGNDTLNNWASGTTLIGGTGDDNFYNDDDASLSVIDAGAGNDSIRNLADDATIFTGSGNDTISNSASRSVISLGGGGNTVRTYVDGKFVVYGGEEDSELRFDVLNGSTIETTIHSGSGNETLYGTKSAELYVFDPDSGNDVIYNIGGEDTLFLKYIYGEEEDPQFEDAVTYVISPEDVGLRFGDGSVQVKNGVGKTLTIVDNIYAQKKVIGEYVKSPQEVIQQFMTALDQSTLKGSAALDEAVKACSSFASTDELISQMLSDCTNAGDAETFLRDKCGIILDNEDIGAISGWDAGGSIVKNKENIMPENGDAYTFTGTSFTKNGLTLNLPSQSSLTSTQKTIINSLYSWWVEEGLDLIAESYGSNYGFDSNSSATVKEMDVVFKSLGSNTLAQVNHSYYTSGSNAGKASKLTLSINTNYYSTITDSINGAASDASAGYLDRTLAHEFTHAVMAANITYFSELPAYICEGMAELTHGIDDNRKEAIKALAGSPSNLAKVLVASTNTVSISGINAPSYSGGYMFLRYLAKQAALDSGVAFNGSSADERVSLSGEGNVIRLENGSGNDVVYGFTSNDTLSIVGGSNYSTLTRGNDLIVLIDSGSITLVDAIDQSINVSGGTFQPGSMSFSNYRTRTLLTATTKNDILTNYGSNMTVNAADGNDSIVNSYYFDDIAYHSSDDDIYTGNGGDFVIRSGKNSSLNGGAGNDYISNVAKNVSISGGAGNDVIHNAYMKFSAFDYVTGGEYSSLDGGEGNDSIFNECSSTTIKGGAGNDTVHNYEPYSHIDGGANNDLILVGYTRRVINTVYEVFDAFEYVDWLHPSSLTGTFVETVSSGSYSTVFGGAGNDTVAFNTSNNVIGYASGDGNDVVYGYNSTDTIRIADDSEYSTLQSGSDVIVSIGSGSIRLVDAGAQSINVDGGNLVSSINTINNGSNNVKISGTSGTDFITNTGERVTIQGNEGDDTIVGSDNGELILVASNHGNDLITNFGTNDTLQCTAGSIATVRTVGDDAVVSLKGASYSATITLAGAGAYKFAQNGNVLTVNDFNTISNTTRSTVVNGSSGADSIYNYAKNVTINALDGDDTIQTYGNSVKVEGGNGNDSIKTTGGSNVTLHGGNGNDTLVGSSSAEVFQYRSDGGSDVITNFGTNDTLHIAAGSLNSYYADGNDLVVHAKGTSYSGYITLQDAASQAVKVKVGSGSVQTINSVKTISNTTRNTLVNGSSGADSIYNYAKNVTINALEGDDTIQTYGNSVKVEGGNGNDSIKTTGGSNVTLHGGNGNDTLIGSSSAEVFQYRSDGGSDVITNFGTNDTLHIAAGSLNSYYVDGNDLVVHAKGTSYSGYITLQDAASQAVKVKVGSGSIQTINGGIVNNSNNVKVSGTSSAERIVNSGSGVTIQGNGGADTIVGSSNAEMILVASNHGNDVITNFGKNDTIRCTAGSISTVRTVGDDAVVSLKGTSYSATVTLQGAGDYNFKQSGAYLTVNDFNTISNTTRNTLISGTSSADSIYNYAKNVTINAAAGNDTIQTYGNAVSVFGGNGNDSIRSTGGSGVTLHGGNGNDTLTGSSSAEVFQFRSDGGNDIVTNFGTNDTLKITAGSIQNYYASGADYVVEVKGTSYSGTITLKNAVESGSIQRSGNTIRLNASNAQLPSEEYWFEQIDQVEQSSDEINSILTIENNEINFEIDPIDRIKASSIEIVESSARSRNKK